MSVETNAIGNVLKRGGFAFVYYPVSMIFAILLSIISIGLIAIEPDGSTKIYNAEQLALAFGAFFNMAMCVIEKKSHNKPRMFIYSNIASVVVSVGVFLALYFTGDDSLSEATISRVLAGIAISFLVFLVVPTFHAKKIHYNEMVFMTVKSFFISIIYALVLMLGFFFVAFTVQQLLYTDLTEKIYAYIAILCALFGYAFYLGNYPEFKKEENDDDESINQAIKQPRFSEIIFQNIFIPILAALTVVLLIWTIRILVTGVLPEYSEALTIFTTYSFSCLFIYYLVSSYDTILVRLFRKIIPIAILVFFSFEAYLLIDRILDYGLKPLEYVMIMTWLFSVVSSILFLFIPVIKNRIPSYLAMGLIVLTVLPGIGATDLSFTMQSNRLKRILLKNNMLINDTIVKKKDLSVDVRRIITDSTVYLYEQNDKKPPEWIHKSMSELDKFEQVFGFSQIFDNDIDNEYQKTTYYNLYTDNMPIKIEGYQYNISAENLANNMKTVIKTAKGEYKIDYDPIDKKSELPKITVKSLKGKKLLDKDLTSFNKDLLNKYIPYSVDIKNGDKIVPADLLTFKAESDEIGIMIVYRSITFTKTGASGNWTSSYDISSIFFTEK